MNRINKTQEVPLNLTALVAKDGDWYIGYVEEIPGANAQEKTMPELIESLKLAVKDLLEIRREDALKDAGSRFREVAFSL